VAIVGRPNVGKSALFNRLAGRRIAIVHDQPGVTRDRVIAEVEWRDRVFTLIDTGGIGLMRGEKAGDVIARAAYEQVQLAIDAAEVIILVVNVQEGLLPLDSEVAEQLRRSAKPVLVAANKADNSRVAAGAEEFSALGFDAVYPVSAIHGEGLETLLEAAMKHVPQTSEKAAQPSEPPLKLAIVGRPNVGKSSIVNALTASERVIVSPIPGTTRDSVDVPFEIETDAGREHYLLIDTAGLRKARRIDDSIEFFSAQRSAESIARSDIVLLVLDAEAGITEQDKKIADIIVEKQRACIVVVNKWDLVDESVRKAREDEIARRNAKTHHNKKVLTTLGEFGEWVQEHLFFLDYAPVIFTSAQSGFHLERLLEAVRYVAGQLRQKVPTAILNRTLQDAVERRQPISSLGHRLKFFYATQVKQAPPTFVLFVNRGELFSDQYRKYLSQQLRAAFGYEGCPIILLARARPKTVQPVRGERRSRANSGKTRPQDRTRKGSRRRS